jgi:hypothetical protein
MISAQSTRVEGILRPTRLVSPESQDDIIVSGDIDLLIMLVYLEWAVHHQHTSRRMRLTVLMMSEPLDLTTQKFIWWINSDTPPCSSKL